MTREVGAKSAVGLVRPNNEDAYYIAPGKDFFVVADGMGGHEAGEVASRLAVQTIAEVLSRASSAEGLEMDDILTESIVRANRAILERSMDNPRWRGMGTTVVAALFSDERFWIAHVGDSRAYLIEEGVLTQLTEDHSKAAELVRRGELSPEEARTHYLRNVVTQAVGIGECLEVDVQSHPSMEKGCLLLCTDGLTDMLDDDEILETIRGYDSPQEMCDNLILSANRKGGKDNITVIIVH